MEIIITLGYLILIVLSISNFRYSLFIFIFHLPIAPLTHIIGTVPYNNYFAFILFAQFIFNFKRCYKFSKNIQKIIVVFSVILFIFSIIDYFNSIKFTILKNGYLPSIPSHILEGIVLLISCINYLFIYRMAVGDKFYRGIVSKAVIASGIILSISVLFSEYLASVGFAISASSLETGRSSGFYAWGDCNGVAGLLCLLLSFLLIKKTITKESYDVKSIAVIFLFIISILSTLSRMGFYTLIMIFLYYLLFLRLSKFNFKDMIFCIILLIAVGILYDAYILPILDRINETASISNELTSGSEGRSEIWLLYLNFMFASSINTILFGTDRLFINIVPHNYFIYSFFLDGIVITIMLILMFIKTITITHKLKVFRYVALSWLTTLMPLMFLTDSKIMIYYLLISILIIGYKNKKTLLPRQKLV